MSGARRETPTHPVVDDIPGTPDAIVFTDPRSPAERLARDLSALVACSRELGDRLKTHARKQSSVVARVNEIAQQVDGNEALTQAEKLVTTGLAVERVSELCALSKGEAALLERWKRRSAA